MLGALYLEKGAVAFISNESGKILYTNNAEILSHLYNKDKQKLECTNLYLTQSDDELWYVRLAYNKN